MILQTLRLFNYRCYSQLELKFHPRFNVFEGKNGEGKTSLLEAMSLLSTLRSFRGAKNSELLKFEEKEGSVYGGIQNKGLDFTLGVRIWPNRKQATLNSKSCRLLSEYVGHISSVSFSPFDLEMLRGEPEFRRNWADKIAQIEHQDHTDLCMRYKRVLEQRNRLLREMSEGRLSRLPDDFEIWTSEVADLGSRIIHNRIHSVDRAVDKIGCFYREISSSNDEINIDYSSSILEQIKQFDSGLSLGLSSGISLEILRQAIDSRLASTRPKEVILGSTLTGPHRDDLEFSLNKRSVRNFSSQGELRSLVLAMRLAEVQFIESVHGVSPLLLIDDFSSELDSERRRYLLQFLMESESQVFLTTTEWQNSKFNGEVFVVTGGEVLLRKARDIDNGNRESTAARDGYGRFEQL